MRGEPMVDGQHRDSPLRAGTIDRVPERLHCGVVECTGGLVEHEHRGVEHEGRGQGEALLLAAGEHRRVCALIEMAEPHQVQGLPGAAVDLVCGQALVVEPCPHLVEHGVATQLHAGALPHGGHQLCAFGGGDLGDVAAVDAARPRPLGVGAVFDRADHREHQGGFPRAGGAHHEGVASGPQCEIDAVERRRPLGKAHAQVVDLDGCAQRSSSDSTRGSASARPGPRRPPRDWAVKPARSSPTTISQASQPNRAPVAMRASRGDTHQPA